MKSGENVVLAGNQSSLGGAFCLAGQGVSGRGVNLPGGRWGGEIQARAGPMIDGPEGPGTGGSSKGGVWW